MRRCVRHGDGVPRRMARRVGGGRPRIYARTRLVDVHGRPLRLAQLVPETNYVFHYPYASTPCLLLKLRRPVTVPGGAQARGRHAATRGRAAWAASATSSRSPRSARTSSRIRRARCRSSAISASAPRPPARTSSIAAPTTACTTPRKARAWCRDRRRSRLPPSCSNTIRRRTGCTRSARWAPSSSTPSSTSTSVRLALEYGEGRARTAVEGTSIVRELAKYCRTTIQC